MSAVFQWVGFEEVSGCCSSVQFTETYQEPTRTRPVLRSRYLEMKHRGARPQAWQIKGAVNFSSEAKHRTKDSYDITNIYSVLLSTTPLI